MHKYHSDTIQTELEVTIRHPDYSRFRELGLKWYALPAISNMSLDFGGLSYPTAPFSGWYMGTEIGARDLFEVFAEVEERQGRAVQADWDWIVPPMSGSATGVFHREYTNEVRTPNFFYRDRSPWQDAEHRIGFRRDAGLSCPFHRGSGVDS